jgi:hypothetical protein
VLPLVILLAFSNNFKQYAALNLQLRSFRELLSYHCQKFRPQNRFKFPEAYQNSRL